MFLIRSAFWISLLIFILPIDTGDNGPDAAKQVSTLEAIGAVSSVVQDVAGLCDRNQQACEVGSAALETFGQKARTSAKMIYDLIDDDRQPGPTAAGDAPVDDARSIEVLIAQNQKPPV